CSAQPQKSKRFKSSSSIEPVHTVTVTCTTNHSLLVHSLSSSQQFIHPTKKPTSQPANQPTSQPTYYLPTTHPFLRSSLCQTQARLIAAVAAATAAAICSKNV